MGRGNFCPTGEMTDQWYLDCDDYYDGEDSEAKIELLEEDIHAVMAEIAHRFPSLNWTDKCRDHYWGQTVLLENKLIQIGIADNEWSTAIWISEKPEIESEMMPLVERHFETYRTAIRRKLLEFFNVIYLRNGAWMSKKWTQEMEEKGA